MATRLCSVGRFLIRASLDDEPVSPPGIPSWYFILCSGEGACLGLSHCVSCYVGGFGPSHGTCGTMNQYLRSGSTRYFNTLCLEKAPTQAYRIAFVRAAGPSHAPLTMNQYPARNTPRYFNTLCLQEGVTSSPRAEFRAMWVPVQVTHFLDDEPVSPL